MSNQNIWVFFELSGGRPKRVCLEMMQKAKALAEGSSEKAVAVIIDPEPEEAVKAAVADYYKRKGIENDFTRSCECNGCCECDHDHHHHAEEE